MEHKNKSFSRIKRHQSDKVLRFSIRKYSFGAASVAVAALMFLGTHVVSADVVDGKNQPAIGAPNPNEEKSPLIESAPTSKNEETKETEKVEVAKETEEREKPSENKEAVEANSLNNDTSTSTITVTKDASGDKVTEKQTLDKSQLQANITKVQELLDKVNKEKAPASTLAAIQADLETAKNALNNNELTQAEIDAIAKKLNEKSFVLSSMPKLVAPKTGNDKTLVTPKTETEIKHSLETVKEDLQKYVNQSGNATDKPNVTAAVRMLENISKQLENTTLTSKELTTLLEKAKTVRNLLVNEELRATSGTRDSRNNRSMGEGVSFRADGVLVEGALHDVKEYISEPAGQGSTAEGQRTRTIEKTFMTAKYSTEGNKKFITYDVYFQNDGKALNGSTGNAFWFYPPRDILYSGGRYVGDTIAEAYYERYQKNAGTTGTLSHNPNNFTKLDTYNALEQLRRNGTNQDDSTRRQWGDSISLYQLDGGPARKNPSQVQQMLKQLQYNSELNSIIRLNNNPTGSLPELSYSQLLTISGGRNYAFKYHVKMRLKDDVTAEQAQRAGTIAVTAKEGKSITALAAYVYSATGTRLESRPDAQLYPIKGKEVIKTVGDSLGDVSNPVSSGFVVRNDDSKNFPNGMSWSWTNGQPNTSTAGIFKYNVTATYSDNSSNSTTATLKVKPKTPVIDQSSVNEKAGERGQNVVVTVQDGVPNGSTVTLYNGNTVIGTGTTSGQKATINVSGALPSTAITAKTSVQNSNGKVESDLSAPVTPTEVPDKVAPTVSINGKALTTNADDNRFIIYRGANFNPTFRVQDDKNNVTLSITNLPKDVGNVSTSGSKDLSYTIPENTVANDAPFGESTATVVASDGRNSATYKFKYRIVDVQASSTETRAVGSELGDPHNQFKVADSASSDSDKYYPTGMQFKWKEFNSSTFSFTDVANNTKLNEVGNVTKYTATAAFPNTVNSKTIDGVNYTIYTPIQKAVQKTFNVTDSVAPTVKLTNLITKNETVLTNTVPTSIDGTDGTAITIFRGAKLVLPLKFSDNASEGRVNVQYVSGLPKGVSFGGSNNKLTFTGANETNPTTHTVEGKVAADATLGYSTVTLKVSDSKDGDVSKGNQSEVKFRVRVLDLDFEPGRVAEPNQSSTTINATKGQNLEDANNYLTVNSGTNRQDQNNFPGGMTFRMVDSTTNTVISKLPDAPGRYVVKARAYFPVDYAGTNEVSEVVTGNSDKQLNGRRYLEKTINFVVKPIAPTIAPQTNGDVTITPANETNVNTLNFTYIHPNGSTQNITATKTGNTWSLTNAPADGVTINENTGVVTIKDRAVKDNQTVTAKSVTADSVQADRVESDTTNGTSPAGDTEKPKFVFNENRKETFKENGDQVVYVTPTETTDIEIGSVTDNSNKLLKVEMSSTISEFGGITFEGVANRTDNVELDAPRKVTVRGVIPSKNGTRNWVGNEVYTRNVRAQDAATLTTEDSAANTVKFKVLIQKDKYTPNTVAPVIEKDITQPNTSLTDEEFNKIKNSLTFTADKGTVKIDKNTQNLTFTSDKVVKVKDDGSYYVSATVTYPDGSSETVEVPVDAKQANKSRTTLTAQEVSIKAAKDKNAQGVVPTTESSRVISNIAIPNNQPQPTAKVLKDNGRITEVDGKKVATVVLTYSDNSTKEVTVPVLEVKPIDITTTFNELDNTVTVKPNTTVENGDKLHVTIRGVGMQLTKTATGYTNSRNDRDITVNQDGSITISLLRNEAFQAGDRVVTRHESNKNGKVDSYETESFAGLKPVEKVPAINLTNLTPKEIEDVKAAVKKANPSVNVAELQVAANGDVTYRHKGAGVGSSDPTPEVRLTETVRERNDAEKIDPTVVTLTRYVTETKHTDEQIKNAITGEHIASKVITGEIPTNGGTVVVKVTYTDGSSEDVKVPVIVTPELTPVKNLNNLTNKEKESVKDKIQALNPTATNIVVKNNGETTLTIPDVTSATLTPDKTVVEAQSNGLVDPAKTPVKNTSALTEEEKGKVEAAIKKVNPNAKTVVVSENGTATVTFNDDTTATLTPDKTVVEAQSNGLVDPAKTPVKNTSALTEEEKGKVEAAIKKVNPNAKTVVVSENGTATVTFNDDTTATLTPDKTVVEAQSNGLVDPPVVDIPEFNGGVNGELPDPVELLKVKLIITKWIDEQGNELKPADAKAPAVLGEANEALEAGEIEGYVFVRTDVNEEGDVVTHIFRKVTPTKPEGNGGEQGGDNKPQPRPEVPTDNTEHKPETEKPTVPDTKPTEQPSQTVDGQVAPSQNQAVLPNTGTKADRATGALGALSLLGAFGLLFAKKKKDDEKETRNN